MRRTFRRLFTWLVVSLLLIPVAMAGPLTPQDITLAKAVIEKNSMTLPGLLPGSRFTVSSGAFSNADALVLYLLKFHRDTRILPPIAAVARMLERLNDAEVHKKAVALFWRDYSTATGNDLNAPNFLGSNFEWYVLTKQTQRMKITNARLQGFVGADAAWRRAMDAQQKYWERSTARENEFILKRGAERVMLDAEAAVAEAERAVASGY